MIFRPTLQEIEGLRNYVVFRSHKEPIGFLYWLQHVFQQLAQVGVKDLSDQEIEAIIPSEQLDLSRCKLEALSRAECERFASRMDLGLGLIDDLDSFKPSETLKIYSKKYRDYVKLQELINLIIKTYTNNDYNQTISVEESIPYSEIIPLSAKDQIFCPHVYEN